MGIGVKGKTLSCCSGVGDSFHKGQSSNEPVLMYICIQNINFNSLYN